MSATLPEPPAPTLRQSLNGVHHHIAAAERWASIAEAFDNEVALSGRPGAKAAGELARALSDEARQRATSEFGTAALTHGGSVEVVEV